ncbi:hypothetical protein LT85_2655 [Collimonas arenae]|uniref:Uncharacterized protein n=1 Tax=Collimonas arenae TaxID=279058 RepID=A0A0A1FAQ8_9BURK|nr:hypothetical protein LT85_2655 [Collimonas arenae]
MRQAAPFAAQFFEEKKCRGPQVETLQQPADLQCGSTTLDQRRDSREHKQ